MTSENVLSLIFCFFSLLPVYGQEYVGSEKDIDTILNNIEAFSKAYINGDYDVLANAYTIDGMILPPGTNIIQGHEAIKKRWMLPDGVSVPHHKISPSKIEVVGDHAYDVGYYEGRTIRKDGSEVGWPGKYLIVWKKTDGEWKILIDAWNRVDN